MRIKTVGTVGLYGEHIAPGQVFDVADEVAVELLEKNAAVDASDEDVTMKLAKRRPIAAPANAAAQPGSQPEAE